MAKMIEEPILIRGEVEVGFFFLSLYLDVHECVL